MYHSLNRRPEGAVRAAAVLGVLISLIFGLTCQGFAQSGETDKEKNQILSISMEEGADKPTVRIATREPVGYRYTVYDSSDPLRVVIDFPGMDVSQVAPSANVESSPVKEIRVSSFDLTSGMLGRVELLLSTQADYNVSLAGNDFRVTFAPTPGGASPSVEKASPEEKTAEAKTAPLSSPAPATSVEQAPSVASPQGETPPAVTEPAKPATVVKAVDLRGNQATLNTNGRIERLKHFTLGAPPRLVVDLFGVKPAFKERVFKAAEGISKVRVGTYADKTRFVFDAEGAVLPKNSVTQQGSDVVVTWGAGTSSSAADARATAQGTPVTVEDVNFAVEDGKSVLSVALSGPAEVFEPRAEGDVVQFGVRNALISRPLRRVIDASAFPSAVRLVTPYTVQAGKVQEVRFSVELKGPVPYSLQKTQKGLRFVVENGPFAEPAPVSPVKKEVTVPAPPPAVKKPIAAALVSPAPEATQPSRIMATAGTGQPHYTGQKISLVFDDADIRKILQLIAEVSDLNIIAGEAVKGNITLRLIDVPWDQALDLIMDIKGLGMLREGNVVRILPKEDIRAMRQSELSAIKEERDLEPVTTEVIKVSYTDLANVEGPSKELLTDRGKITKDSRNKQLIVTDIPSVVDAIRNLVTVLDTPERQVLIEARIVEATSTFNVDLGINWGVSYDNQGTSTWGSPQFGDVGFGGNFIIPPFAPETGQAAGLGSQIMFGRVGIDSVSLDLRLSALETSGYGKIISNPRVTTLNGEKAKISQGTKIPYQTVSQTEIKTELVEAALSLEVEPVINPDDSVILKIKATNSSPGTTVATGAGAAPSIDTKEAETKMLVRDGETTVIGGIFIERDDYSENGVPWVMRLPIIGHLFKSTKTNKNRSELLVFITPRIVQ